MKISRLGLFCLLITVSASSQSVYNAKEAFFPQFYPYAGNEYRSASGEPGPKYWQNRADYKITCTIDTTLHSISGVVELNYTNNSPDNLKFLWLQLDQNIYRKDSRGSSTTTETGGRYANEGYTQGYVIRSVTVTNSGKNYKPRHITSDTRMQVWLEDALKSSGGSVKIAIEFSFSVPEYGTDRMGRLNTQNGWVYTIAQWFPRVCVYDDLQGWNVLPYIGAGEFYLEFGDIEYSVTAPANMIIVGSGELQNPSESFTPEQYKRYKEAMNSDKTVTIRSERQVNDKKVVTKKGMSTWNFTMKNTRDVAWAASSGFIVDGARINLSSGKKALALSAYPIESTKERKGNDWRRSTEMVKASIEHYSEKWYEYPYPSAVNVAGIVGGMEYPGIIFCYYKATGSGLWSVTDHELGHTWFPMIVGSNERKYAWMDEGFNEFINGLSTEAYNKGEFHAKTNLTSTYTVRGIFGEHVDGLFNVPDAVQEGSLATTAYYKPAMMLALLRESVLGPERFDAAFKEYIHRWAFKHPTPWDFFHTMENVAGEDLNWFWRGWVMNNWKIDQAVKGVVYVKDVPANGAVITVENMEKMPMPVTVLVKETNGKEHRINLPVEIWQRGSEWTFGVPTTSEIKEVILDPDNRLPDWNRENNLLRKGF
ncbi:MAG: M1 family metallopeptidase [Chitinophagaceae bacterium]|nr:M1 family metallopeptidase [Chitinophagaceae bacterium]